LAATPASTFNSFGGDRSHQLFEALSRGAAQDAGRAVLRPIDRLPYPNLHDGRWMVSRGGGNTPIWGPSGSELFYRTNTSMVRVPIQTSPSFPSGPPEVLFSAPYRATMLDRGRPWALSHDGQRFLLIKETPLTLAEPHIVVVERRLEELKRLAPAR
jgi:hypothetical protein